MYYEVRARGILEYAQASQQQQKAEERSLRRRFHLPFASIRDGYCDFKDSAGRQITANLKSLVNTISTIPCMQQCRL
jgi:hypothetical protein